MQVFVSGTWQTSKAQPWKGDAELLGRLIAEQGHDLACGPGTGIARHVVDGYRGVLRRGRVRYYLPLKSEMQAVGESIEPGFDEIVETEFDYPMRNVFQIKQSQAVFVVTGGDGTLEEVLPALIDYHIPVAVLEESGTASVALQALLPIYPAWRSYLSFGRDIRTLASEMFSVLSACPQTARSH